MKVHYSSVQVTCNTLVGVEDKHFLQQIYSTRRHIRESSGKWLFSASGKLSNISLCMVTSKKSKASVVG